MLLRLLVAMLMGGVAVTAFCQPPPSAAPPAPNYIIYDAFFSRVMWLEDISAQIAAQGKEGSGAGSTIRNEAGLTFGEESALKAVAKKWRQQTDAVQEAVRALVAAGRARDAEAMQELQSRRVKVILDSVDELKSMLGPERFARFDGYIRATTKVRPPSGIPPEGGRK